jgi:8-oxo-dGTP diphosphatase
LHSIKSTLSKITNLTNERMSILHKILPNVSVDCVIFGFDFEKLNVLLVERKFEDVKSGEVLINDLTLTGYHIYEDEDIDSAASRILKDITGFENIYLDQFYTFGKTDRVLGEKDQLWLKHINQGFSDRILTVGYFSLIDSTKVSLEHAHRKIQWYPVESISDLDLAFDHKQIFYKALEFLRIKVKVEPIVFELLPERFTLTQLQKLYEAVFGSVIDKRNFRKKVSQMPYVIPLNEKQKGVPHKPAQLYLFSREVFEKTRKERIGILY